MIMYLSPTNIYTARIEKKCPSLEKFLRKVVVISLRPVPARVWR